MPESIGFDANLTQKRHEEIGQKAILVSRPAGDMLAMRKTAARNENG